MYQTVQNDEMGDILATASLIYEENLLAENADNCNSYGCTCIAYEKCCGCFIQ